MHKKERLKMLRELSEEDLTKRFLIPLYESKGMGYKNVRYTHKKGLEYGRDMVCWKDDEYDNRIYTGVQVKKIRITAGEVDRIAHQIREAFGEPFTDSDGKKQTVDKVVLLTSNEFSEEAKDSLWADLRDNKWDKLVTFVGGNQLVSLLEKHLPSALWDEYDYFNKYFNAMKFDFETIKDISAIGQKEPISLENIYVSLRLSEKIREREIPIEKEQRIFEEELMRGEAEGQVEREKVIDAEKAIKDYNRLVIVGVPGSGKSTLLKYLALKSCKENLEKQERTCVPIPITLQEFSDSKKDLREYIGDVFEKYQFPKAKDFVEKDLKEGKCRLLLDGFDELATKEKQDVVGEKIHSFVEKYQKARVIVTSRIAGYHDELKDFTKLALVEFDDNQIEKFIENWFEKTDPKKANSMFNAIEENEQIKAIARNPLMIAIIAIIYEEDRELPQKRAALYNRCVEVLLSRWDVQKKLKNKYPSDKKEFILRKLAFYGHMNNKRILTEKEVTEEMIKYFPQIQLQEEDAKPFLDEICQRSYLLRQVSIDTYDFLHLSFQEYFTALELKEQADGISTIIKHLSEPWWGEPVLLYAGICKDATTLINRINNDVPEDIFYSNLMLFGKCVAVADFTEPTLKEKIIDELRSLYQTAEFSPLREKAINVLASIKTDRLIQQLILDLESKESDVRGRAAFALGQLGGEKAVEPLIKALTADKESGVRVTAAFALGRSGGEKAVEPLIKALTADKESGVRGTAAEALGWSGNEKAVKPLIKALTADKESDVRWSAAFALGRSGSEKAVEPLIKALSTDKESDVRWSAAFALGQLGSEKAIKPLTKVLSTAKESNVRESAAEALGWSGSEKAVEPLIKALTADKESGVRVTAAFALGRSGGEKAVEPLIKALTADKESGVRGTAAFALGRSGGEKAIETLTKTLTTAEESDIRRRAANALGRSGSEKAVEPLIKALTADKESGVRGSAAFALGRSGGEKAVEPLIKALTADKESGVRGSAADALGWLGSEKAVEPLIKALTTDKESGVRGSAADALGRSGSEKAVEPLRIGLKDEGEYFGEKVKDSAFAALEKISRRIKTRIPIE